MVRHLRILSLIIVFFIEFVSLFARADELDLAQNFIEQNDCENAIPILRSALKGSKDERLRRILLNISLCAEQLSDFALKKQAEQLLVKQFPDNVNYQLKYIDTLFYLSSYKDIIQFAKNKKTIQKSSEFWLALGRTYFELNQYEKSANAFQKYLRVAKTNKSEAYYWIGKNEVELEEYSSAIDYFNKALEEKDVKPWVKTNALGLLEALKEKNKRYHGRLKLSYGYDTNILRDVSKLSDQSTTIDMTHEYSLIKKRKTQLGLGLDLGYVGYNANYSYQTFSASARLDYSQVLSDKASNGFSLSLGKIQTNFKADQNYTFASYYMTYNLEKTIDLQPSLTYFANLNNSPIKQTSFTLSAYFYLETDYMWLSPYYRISDSPQAVIDDSTGVPFVAVHSTATTYDQHGMIIGYQKYISEKWSATAQYSYSATKYDVYNLSSYPGEYVNDRSGREDRQHTYKLAVQYVQTPTVKWSLTENNTSNVSRGFQGFTYPSYNPDYNYDQNYVTLGVTLDWP